MLTGLEVPGNTSLEVVAPRRTTNGHARCQIIVEVLDVIVDET